jgi:hypothetical protein
MLVGFILWSYRIKGAALALGVSQQTVLQKLKSGQLSWVKKKPGRF